MQVDVKVNPCVEDVEVLITAEKKTQFVNDLVEVIWDFDKHTVTTLTGYIDNRAYIIKVADILRIFALNQKVYIQTANAAFLIKYDALKLAFVTMMNKLVFGHQMVLRTLLQSLRGLNDQSRLLKIEELETAIEKNREQKQVLTNLMASGYLEPALFNKESNELAAEAETLRQEKDGLMRSVNGDMVKIEELQRLLRFTSKGTMMTEFDDETFLSFAERITVLSRKEVIFELKCGLSLKERLVEP